MIIILIYQKIMKINIQIMLEKTKGKKGKIVLKIKITMNPKILPKKQKK